MSQRIFGRVKNSRGISLIEITVIITVIAIMAALAMQSLSHGLDQGRKRKTEREMTMLQHAIAGNPSQMSVAGGVRFDFGYIGDVGSFPPDLEALFTNPDGYSTWNGPYIPAGYATDLDDFRTDEWGQGYSYNGGLEIVSHGSGGSIRKGQSLDADDFLLNTVCGVVRDRNDSVPSLTRMDSVAIEVVVPDGEGNLATKLYQPDWAGEFSMDSIPAGRHLVRAIYTPEVDTLLRYVHVMPRHSEDEMLTFNFGEDYFEGEESGGDSMITLVEGSQEVYGSGTNCDKISFDIYNGTGEDVELTSIELTWSSPTAYYQEVWWESTRVWNSSTPRNGSGDVANFTSSQTIAGSETVTIGVYLFKSSAMGGGSTVDMSGVTFTVLLSDGSTFDVTMGIC